MALPLVVIKSASVTPLSTHFALGLTQITAFNLAHLYLAPPLGETPLEFRRDLWHKKLESLCYDSIIAQ